jgi:hypothetical protein
VARKTSARGQKEIFLYYSIASLFHIKFVGNLGFLNGPSTTIDVCRKIFSIEIFTKLNLRRAYLFEKRLTNSKSDRKELLISGSLVIERMQIILKAAGFESSHSITGFRVQAPSQHQFIACFPLFNNYRSATVATSWVHCQ